MDLVLRGLEVRFGRSLVLDIGELRLFGERVTAVLGPNGAGKSTLLRVLAGLVRPAHGAVLIDGAPVPARVRRGLVALSFQRPVFVSGTVRENLDLALRLRGVPRQEREARISSVAEACGIAELLRRPARALSGGEAQRANLARALALQAPLTLLDEPLAGIDGPARRSLLAELRGLLRRFARSVVLVTHDPEEASRLADDVVVLLEGRVHACGPKSEVFRRPPDAATAAFLGWTVLPGEGGDVAVPPGGFRFGGDGFRFRMRVDAVLDRGYERLVEGAIAGSPVTVPLPPSAPAPAVGSEVEVVALPEAVERFSE